MRVTFPLIPAAYTSTASVQVSGFEDLRLLAHCGRLPCDSCSSGQCFAFGFLQIPPRGGHPCRSANRSPCRADSGLSLPSHPATTMCTGTAPVKALRAMPGARRGRTCAARGLAVASPYGCRGNGIRPIYHVLPERLPLAHTTNMSNLLNCKVFSCEQQTGQNAAVRRSGSAGPERGIATLRLRGPDQPDQQQ